MRMFQIKMQVSGLSLKMVGSKKIVHIPTWLIGWNWVEVSPSTGHTLSSLVQVGWSPLCSVCCLLEPCRPLVFHQKPKLECFHLAQRWQYTAGKPTGAAWDNCESFLSTPGSGKNIGWGHLVSFSCGGHYSIDEGVLDWRAGTWM